MKGVSRQKTSNNNSVSKKNDASKSSTSVKRVQRSVAGYTKEKSPLTPAKARTNVKKESSKGPVPTDKLPNHHGGAVAGQTTSDSENLRRKTRSTAANKRVGK